jgi:hypothetical protein|tara:strand:+ start:569 stop:778 length:210 start_codon:yes stop_codon:yes gene_type:complete
MSKLSVKEMAEEVIKEATKVMAFCEELRLSGKTNMLGAVPYIQEEFDMESSQARNYLILYFESFKTSKS